MAAICVFCGSQPGNDSLYTESARSLAGLLVQHGHTLVYGGGGVGMMGTLADEVLNQNGRVIGVIPDALANVEMMHADVADMRIVSDMHARKAMMHELADGYIALPGGYGTMEELFEVLCWAQLAFHQAPVAVLNLNGMYDGLIQQIDVMLGQGFLSAKHRQLLNAATSVNELNTWLTKHF